MRDEFSTLDIVKALKIPRERLRDWMNQGFIKPTTPAKGQGTKAVFTRNDVYLIEFFRFLINKGFSRENAAECLHKFNDQTEGELHKIWRLVVKYKDKGFIITAIDEEGPKNKYYYMNLDNSFFLRVDAKAVLAGDTENLDNFAIEHLIDSCPDDWIKTARWDAIMIYNFHNIRQKVDLALASLD